MQKSECRYQKSELLEGKGLGTLRGTKSEARCRMAEVRSSGGEMTKGCEKNEERCTMNERTSHVTFGGRSFSNIGERSCVVKSSSHESIQDRALTRELPEGQVMAEEP